MPPEFMPIPPLAGAPAEDSAAFLFKGSTPESILVLRGGALGDFVLTLPALRLLRSAFPDSRVDLIAHPRIASLAQPPYVQRITSLEKAALASFFFPDSELDPALASYIGSFDLVVSYLHDPERVFEFNVRACGVRNFLQAYRTPSQTHAAEEWALPLRTLGLVLESPQSIIYPTDAERSWARQFLESPEGTRWVAIHPGSGSPRKNWPVSLWCEVAGLLLKKWPRIRLLVAGGEADAAQRDFLRSRLSEETTRIRFAWDQPPRLLSAILEACAFFVGHDSGVSHVAAAVGTRCLLLFGPTNPAVWAPAGAHVRVIQSSSGAPESIPPSAVFAACGEMLDQFGPCQQKPIFGE